MTMTYSFEKKYNPWDIEPDVYDSILEELENEKEDNTISLEDVADDELELDEEFDL